MRYIIYASILCSAVLLSAEDAQKQEQQKEGASWQGQTEEAMPTQERGNWYITHRYAREIEDVFSQLREIQKQIEGMRDQFVAKRDTVTQIITSFYEEERIEVNELLTSVKEVISTLEKQRKRKDEELSQQEREWLRTAQSHKLSLQEIQEQIEAIAKLRSAAEEVVTIFDNQLDAVDQYADTAWNAYQSILQTVSDQVAQQKYYTAVTALDNTQQIHTYVSDKLTSFADTLIKQAKNQTSRLRQLIDEVEQLHIGVRRKVMPEQQEQPENGDGEEDTQEQQDTPEQQQEPTTEAPGWYTWLTSPLYQAMQTVWHAIVAAWKTLISPITG